ncbi:MAG: AEC family transporter, partial [Lachnospiraceae bacterium]|nr:AEC family transporter [Lachnospiraceae bacterium]
GIRGANLIATLMYSGSPTAVNSYSTAVSMGGNEELAGEVVAVTSLLSVFTLFLFLTALQALGLV